MWRNRGLAHNKLYRNFIILQEDEKNNSTSGEKALSGYAKIEAKSDKCKISFYAQNLREDEKYSIVLICYKKNIKQVVDLGSLIIKQGGKGEVTKEYYVNNIGGVELCYDKISGAAVAKRDDNKYTYVMYGFMNGENIKEDWKSCKVIQGSDIEDKFENKCPDKKETKCKVEETQKDKKECCKEDHEHKDIDKVYYEKKKEEKEYKDKEYCCKDKEKHKDKDDDKGKNKCEDNDDDKEKHKCEDRDKDKDKEKHKYKDEGCSEENDKHKNKHKEKDSCDEIEEKKEHKDKDCVKEKEHDKKEKEYEKDYKKLKHLELNDDHDCLEYCSCKDKLIADFDEYETRIEREKIIDCYDFELRGGLKEYFKEITNGFEEIKNKYKDVKFCKWYKVRIGSIDDMCNAYDYDKYNVVYSPMINYYPYIRRHGYFLLGYKCSNKGDVNYIVYGIPGRRDKEEQPFMGRTGFVTWMKTDNSDMGVWLMFYDYKKSIVVVPIRE